MKQLFTLSFFTLFQLSLLAQDTFSIIAADPETGQIGSAGASCVDNIAPLGGVILLNDIIPGQGGINAQAYICIPHINLTNGMEQMANGLSPDEIIDWLVENDACNAQAFNPDFRQYGIVDLDSLGSPRTAAWTGESADDYKGHILGPNYAIQGNILIGPEVLENMEAAFLANQGTLAQKLMAAMQGANIVGADVRCEPRGTSSTSAFLRVYKPDDVQGSPTLELNVAEMPFGEEPIDSLQTLFDEFLLTSTEEPSFFVAKNLALSPNPTSDIISLGVTPSPIANLMVYNTSGEVVIEQTQAELFSTTLNVSQLAAGIYFLRAVDVNSTLYFAKFVKQ